MSGRLAMLGAGVLACAQLSCAAPRQPAPAAPSWLAEEDGRRSIQLERHLRGFDVAMMETGYRYTELYFAARDGNWEAASYHAEKLRTAIENGVERRPQRAASARTFLGGPLARLDRSLAERDAASFRARFEELTAGCNTCHTAERVPFFVVRAPETRLSPIRGGEGSPHE